MTTDNEIREDAIESVVQQIADFGCTSGRQSIVINGEVHEIAWALTINVLH